MLQGVACGGAAIPSGEHLRHASRDGKARSPQFMAPPCNAPESASRAAVSRRRGGMVFEGVQGEPRLVQEAFDSHPCSLPREA